MKLTIITNKDALTYGKVPDYHVADKANTLIRFERSLKDYQKAILQKNQDADTETNQILIFNKLLSSVHNYHFEIDKNKMDISIWDNLKLKVIIEAKRGSNKNEMINDDNGNKKALHEAILYYYEQRMRNVFSVNHVIITDYLSVYLFNAKEFEKLINNKTIQSLLDGFANKELLLIQKRDELYRELESILNNIDITLDVCKIDLFDKSLDLETVYKLFDQYYLLRTPLENKEHNVLDPKFYNELLYVMGLQEIEEKVDGKKLPVIRPLLLSGTANNNNLMTMVVKLIENKRNNKQIDSKMWARLGDDDNERYFTLALELVLTWINRILFLKLLEAQLLSYHKDSENQKLYQFLSFDNDKLSDWDDVNKLFFEVLAKPVDVREYKHIPYLNSALFETTEYEKIIDVSLLGNREKLDISKESILTDKTAKPVLQYLLEFLDCYNFGRGDDNVSETKRLINAAVLGLIFEQLNGYKDGAIYTPSFITMSMSRDALTKTVIQKFNEVYNWTCESLVDVSNSIIQNRISLKDANDTFNSIRVVDPAVGSGHFLVSVLNELLYIKHHGLGILCDKDGRLIRCDMEIRSDELLITYDGTDFSYHVNADNKPLDREMQRIQETLFHEKERLIENCLFGVDINPKSAYICQLRLWIELLKNTYYIQPASLDSKIQNLQTLPNIDINIKTGNSLVSKFDLKQDFGTMISGLAKRGTTIEHYRDLVYQYKNTHNKSEKLEIKEEIAKIKLLFKKTFEVNDVDYQKLVSKYDKARKHFSNIEYTIGITKEQIDKAQAELDKAEAQLEKADSTYFRSMEWWYEFPEVLSNDGRFIGFDLVIGNPPYFKYNRKHYSHVNQINHFRNHELYNFACMGEINAYEVFLILSYQLCKQNGFICEIFQNSFLGDKSSVGVRKFYIENTNILSINSFPERDSVKKRVFDKVKMSVMTLLCQKNKETKMIDMKVYSDRMKTAPKEILVDIDIIKAIDSESMEIPNLNEEELKVFAKCYNSKKRVDKISTTFKGELDPYTTKHLYTNDDTKTLFLVGANVQKYFVTDTPSQRTMPLYFNKEQYLREFGGERSKHYKIDRIVWQEITGVDSKYRINATVVTKGNFLSNTCAYLIPNKDINFEYLLGLMNSWLLNWLFKARSTNAHTTCYERLHAYRYQRLQRISRGRSLPSSSSA